MLLTPDEKLSLEKTANEIRESIIEMLVKAGSGHTAGPLGMGGMIAAASPVVSRHPCPRGVPGGPGEKWKYAHAPAPRDEQRGFLVMTGLRTPLRRS